MTTEVVLALGAFFIAFLLRVSPSTRPVLLPLSLFAVLVHELSHGLAAIFSGGQFERFQMERDGGVAYTRGGRSFLIIPAGYVGTAIFGAVLIYFTNALDQPSGLAIGLGVAFALLTILFSGMSLKKLTIIELGIVLVVLGVGGYLLFSQPTGGARALTMGIGVLGAVLFVYFISDEYFFTVLVGILASLGLIGVGIYGYEQQTEVTRFVLNFLAFMVGLNTIYDSWYLFRLIQQPKLSKRGNDATNMAKITPFPAWFWALVWSVNALVMLSVALGLVVAGS